MEIDAALWLVTRTVLAWAATGLVGAGLFGLGHAAEPGSTLSTVVLIGVPMAVVGLPAAVAGGWHRWRLARSLRGWTTFVPCRARAFLTWPGGLYRRRRWIALMVPAVLVGQHPFGRGRSQGRSVLVDEPVSGDHVLLYGSLQDVNAGSLWVRADGPVAAIYCGTAARLALVGRWRPQPAPGRSLRELVRGRLGAR